MVAGVAPVNGRERCSDCPTHELVEKVGETQDGQNPARSVSARLRAARRSGSRPISLEPVAMEMLPSETELLDRQRALQMEAEQVVRDIMLMELAQPLGDLAEILLRLHGPRVDGQEPRQPHQLVPLGHRDEPGLGRASFTESFDVDSAKSARSSTAASSWAIASLSASRTSRARWRSRAGARPRSSCTGAR